jgi:DNA-binding response OmpR family regulator
MVAATIRWSAVPRLLLVEDDDAIAEPLARALRRDGYEVDAVDAGGSALEAEHGRYDLVLLDLGLPDLDGLEVCRRLRARAPALPILVLTARADEVDTVVGLDAGADDYVTKPFRLAELAARVRALLRRTGGAVHQVNGIEVDEAARRAWADGRELSLTPKEFDLLLLLVREAGAAVPRERIIEEVWDPHWYGPTKTLDMHVSSLRRKLGDDPASPRWLATVRGVGYRFERSGPDPPCDAG